jgi:predicted aldo/keto reductase-like oxidoreductase
MHSLYWESWLKMKSLGVTEFIERAKRDGRIRRIGFSSHANREDYQKIIDDYKWEFTQIQVNYADWNTKPGIRECYEIAEKAGVPVIVMEPVRGGGLANPDAPAVKKISSMLRPGVTPAAIAFRWTAGLKAAFVILSGMSAVPHVEENLKTFSPIIPLAADEIEAVNETISVMKSFPTVPCTSCEYCLEGCPNEIPIDDLFNSFNAYQYYGNARHFLQFFPGAGNRPSDCIGCGACSSVCPQGINVPIELKRVDALYNECATRGLVT